MTGEVQARLPTVEKTTLAQASGIAMMPEVLGGSCSQNNGSHTKKIGRLQTARVLTVDILAARTDRPLRFELVFG